MSKVQTLPAYLENAAGQHADQPAVVDPTGRVVSYRQLNARANQTAHLLAKHGVGAGDRVGLGLPKSAEAVAAIFGILKAGAAYVPVDFAAPSARNRLVFSNCRVRAALVDARIVHGFAARTEPALTPPPTLMVYGSPSSKTRTLPGCRVVSAQLLDQQPTTPLRHRPVRPGDLAYVLYTSGSTGQPKGVILTHENATSFVDWCSDVFAPTPADRFSGHAPFHFDLSVLDLYLSIKHGATLYLVSEELAKDPKRLGPFIAENRLTIWYSVPSILALLAKYGGLDSLDCSPLRLVLFAGEVFPLKHLRRLKELWPHPVYFNLYGPTETNVCTWYRIPDVIPDDRQIPFPIGRPCAHCDALVLNQARRPVAAGEDGLLHIAGKSVMRGYWGAPERDAEVFVEYEGQRYYNTGDVVRLDEHGDFLFLGRCDRMVKRRGYRIELGEIEAGLHRHPDVHDVAVIARPVEDAVLIEAVVVPRSGTVPSIIQLKQHCAQVLPAYMSPDRILFLDKLPMTSTNKLDYEALRRLQEARSS
jgi:amino acid adenylation domain-containing protein